jgi:hypothetical protein
MQTSAALQYSGILFLGWAPAKMTFLRLYLSLSLIKRFFSLPSPTSKNVMAEWSDNRLAE